MQFDMSSEFIKNSCWNNEADGSGISKEILLKKQMTAQYSGTLVEIQIGNADGLDFHLIT